MQDQKYVAIKDIAKACGVSTTTVSLALRNHPRISEDTRKRISETAERMNYRRNPMISALMTNLYQSRKFPSAVPLAVLYTHELSLIEENSYHQKLWQGMSNRAEELGFKLEKFCLNRKITGKRMTQILTARGINGVIIPPLLRAGGHLSLDWEQFSVLALGYSLLSPNFHRVCPNQYQGIRTVMRQLKHVGFSRPGMVLMNESDLRTAHLWSSGFYGFEHAVKKTGIIPVLEYVNSDKGAVMDWYRKYTPDVIIGSEPDVLELFRSAGLKIPEEVGFVTLSRWSSENSIAGIDENEEMLGRAAIEQLVHLVYYNQRGCPECPYVIQVPCKWGAGITIRK
ncbi:MAG TPA: LacI family DNA-binding transcriptional regulator [Pontiellaceae bacterium]|nr:LacI family DNA-binding transcriptional regulator [Pontiellaceae bacterium]